MIDFTRPEYRRQLHRLFQPRQYGPTHGRLLFLTAILIGLAILKFSIA